MSSIEQYLKEIAQRLTALEEQTTEAARAAKSLPDLAATAGDAFDEHMSRIGNAEERFLALSSLLERLSQPSTLRALRSAVELFEQAPNTVAILADSLEEALAASEQDGVRVDELLSGLIASSKRAVKLLASREFRVFLDSPMLERGMVETLGRVATAVAGSAAAPQRQLGVFGVMKAMGKPNVQRAVGFAMEVADRLGSVLFVPEPWRALPTRRQQ